MRYLSVAWLLPVLLVAQSAEAARISFATKDCGTPPLLDLTFGIDATGVSVVLDSGDACPGESFNVIPGDLVDDDTDTPLYGTSISSLDLTILSGQTLDVADFQAGDFFDSSLGFGFTFEPFDSGGGVLSISFDADILLSCTLLNPDLNTFDCENLDLLIFIDGGGDTVPLVDGTIVRVTRVNDFTVPEPGTLALLGIGLTAAAVRRRTTAKT
jgi:hypothetical protein